MIRIIYRALSKYQRTVSDLLYRRIVTIKTDAPIISFSFDDALRTACCAGGEILRSYDAHGTYFVSLGLLGVESPGGLIASEEDLRRAVADGHELGCHTYDHRDPWRTSIEEYENTIKANRRSLANIFPELNFMSFAYPLREPRPAIKGMVGKLFNCCRCGGQTSNLGTVDLNLLKGYFLDGRNRHDIDGVKKLIDCNAELKGWLIFVTHDLADNPSRYGCKIDYFKTVVKYSASSGASLLSVSEGYDKIQAAIER